MNYGDIKYIGHGNGIYGNLAKIEIVKYGVETMNHKSVKMIENYASMWESGPARIGSISSMYSKNVFDTFEEALEQFIKDMRLKSYRDIFQYIFKSNNA